MTILRRFSRSAAPGVAALALLAAACTGGGGAASSDAAPGSVLSNASLDWRDEVIYQALTDRFADGDVNNNQDVNRTALAKWQGGDFEGIRKKADYLQALGVTAVWISPVIRNVSDDAGVSGYHGYWAQDFTRTDPHFGDLGALRRMVQSLHARGIKVILDIVTNHIGPLFFYDINLNGSAEDTLYGSGTPGSPVIRVTEYDPDWDPNGISAQVGGQRMGPAPVRWIRNPSINRMPPEPAVFQNPDWYHRKGRVVPLLSGVWPADQVLLGDFPGGLKDLATERQDVRDAMVQVYGDWITKIDFDGFRIDTVKHVEHSFWTDFCPRIRQIAAAKGKKNFLMFGEAFDGDDGVNASYTQRDMMDSVFYFPQKYQAYDGVIKYAGPTKAIEDLWNRRPMYGTQPQAGGIGVSPSQSLVNFIDNHDVPRFLFGLPDTRRMEVALGFLFLSEGIPCVYYGTEQGFNGGGDPSNRERLWDSGYDTRHPLFLLIQALAGHRRNYAAIRRGTTQIRWATTRTGAEEDAGIFAFERTLVGAESVLYVMNVSGSKSSRTALGGAQMQTSFPQGATLKDLLDATFSATVGAGGTVTIEVPPVSQRLLVAR